MSGTEGTREPGGEADSSAVPASPAPRSFGGASPPAPPAEAPAPTAPRRPPFGLEAPWWAADSTEDAPGPVSDDAATDGTATGVSGANDTASDVPGAAASAPGAPPAPSATSAPGTPPVASATSAPGAASAPPGTLVAGVGIPRVDSRGAVPAEPLVPPASSTFTETDPDGIPAVRPDEAQPPPAGNGTAPPAAPASGQAAVATPNGAAASTREAEPAVPPSTPSGDVGPAAFERAKEAEKAPASAAPVLVPDAILPRGFRPPSGESGPNPQTDGADTDAEEPPVITPVHHEQGVPPSDTPPPPGQAPGGPDKGGKGGRNKRTLLIGGGGAVVLAAVIALFAIGGAGSSDDGATRKAAERPVETPTTSAPTQAPPPPAPDPTPLKIDNEKTDPEPLAFKEVFAAPTITLDGHAYRLDRRSINRDLKYAANGAMLQALQQHQCRKIVRATYVDAERAIAVTSGIAVMPTKTAAITVSQAGDPARYQWFRGMTGKHTANIDRAGGYAAVTVRGRYVVYAYVQHSNGAPVRPGEPVAKQIAQQFIDHNARPLDKRARS